MRRFHDGEGVEWTVAVSAGSYGAITLMFAAAGNSGVCWLALEADNAAEAQTMLADFSDEELRVRLARAEWWDDEGAS
jgi:hypothetical protein